MGHFTEEEYTEMIESLFQRFPSFQKVGAGAYKPGTGNMEFMDQLMGHPHRNYKVIHVAGTNGKGSVSNMLASVLAACGYRVGLYTSPHILDFRERMRVIDDNSCSLITKEAVMSFVCRWQETFDHLDMSFFEITTSMALDWFAAQGVDYVVLETGLGGRLDSTNIVTPVLSVITNIGLDHCDLLGDTLPEIAFEKAGIIKPVVPVVVGESHPETDDVFRRKVLYTNLSEPKFMGDRNAVMSLLTFADKVEPTMWDGRSDILEGMDLKGSYQRKNLRTVLAALDVLGFAGGEPVCEAIKHTARRTGFRGRWETVSENPRIIADIGHNAHGLRYNFSQLEEMLADGRVSDLIVVYGSVADKDIREVLPLMPEAALYIFTQAHGKRALAADAVAEMFAEIRGCASGYMVCPDAAEAIGKAVAMAESVIAKSPGAKPLIYVGGSTYVVSEVLACLNEKMNIF